MKKKLFSKGIYVESLRRLRTAGIIMLAVMLLVQIVPVIVQVSNYMFYLEHPENYEGGFTPDNVSFDMILAGAPTMSMLVAPVMVLILLSVFNKRSSSDFYHALPYTRTCFFLSTMAAVYTWVLGTVIVCSAIGAVLYTSMPKLFVVSLTGAFELVLSYFAVLLITTGAVALAMALTGTLITNVCVALLILFLPRFLITVLSAMINSRADFLALSQLGSSFLAPSTNVFFSVFAEIMYFGNGVDFYNNLSADIYSICLGLVYLALALFAFNKRKSETATRPAPDRFTQHIIRILITMVIAVFPPMLFIEGEPAGGIIVGLITVIVYFAYELITTHKWANCVRALPGLGVVAALSIVAGVLIVAVPVAASGYTPDAEDIDSIRLISYSDRYDEEWFAAETKDLEIEDKEVLEIVAKAISHNMESYRTYGHIYSVIHDGYVDSQVNDKVMQTVVIKEGFNTRYRNIVFTGEEYSALLGLLQNNEKYIEACMTMPEPAKGSLNFGLSSYIADESYKMEIFECLREEIKEKTLEEWYYIATSGRYMRNHPEIAYYTDDYNFKFVSFGIYPDELPKTFEMILKTDEFGYSERFKDMERVITDDSEVAEGEYRYMSLEVMVYDGEYYYADAMFDSNGLNQGTWQEQANVAAFGDMLEKVKDCDERPTSESFILVTYDYTSSTGEKFEEGGLYGYIYLPLPEDFDYEAWGFKPYYDTEMFYEYKYLD
ncbi:MAG: hypothetical protein IJD22_00170 [Clostridia bacterium]|nr:hypothetical protein [Clostridia bacterium]